MSSKPLIILVIDSSNRLSINSNEWSKIFSKFPISKYLGSLNLQVEQAGWDEISLSSYSDSNCIISIKSRSPAPRSKVIKPDFILIRNEVHTINNKDYRNILFGLMHANIPSVNSLESVYMCLEKPITYGALLGINRHLGTDKFPLIDQYYYSNYGEMQFPPKFPIVVKVAHVHAGYGKMVVNDQHSLNDLSSIVALHGDYCSAESFLTGIYDLRIQKIGKRYRVFKRVSVSGEWKTNTGTSFIEEIKITERYKLWADECSKLFGGMDILAVDAIVTEDNREYILELNGTSIGLGPDNEREDNEIICELVLQKMSELFSKRIDSSTRDALTANLKNNSISNEIPALEVEVEVANLKNEKGALQLEVRDFKENIEIKKQQLEYYYQKYQKLTKKITLISTMIGVLALAVGIGIRSTF